MKPGISLKEVLEIVKLAKETQESLRLCVEHPVFDKGQRGGKTRRAGRAASKCLSRLEDYVWHELDRPGRRLLSKITDYEEAKAMGVLGAEGLYFPFLPRKL